MTIDLIPTELGDARIISNTEVDNFGTCERKHLFSFIFNKEPRQPGRSLGIGILGHEILAVYYRAIKAGMSKDEAEREALKDLTQMFMDGNNDPEVLSMVHALVTRYIAQDVIPATCEIIAVEEDFYLPINKEFWYGMRLDLLVRAKVGRERGKYILVDHKFTYDFYTDDDLKLNPQLPKYVSAIRYAGIPVSNGYINQLRTRFHAGLIPKKSDTDLFNRASINLTEERVKSSLNYQMILSKRIIDRQKLPLELQLEEAVPKLNKMVCRNCPFKLPCEMMNEGRDITRTLEAHYKPRSYGYTKVELDG